MKKFNVLLKIISLLVSLSLFALICGCGKSDKSDKADKPAEKSIADTDEGDNKKPEKGGCITIYSYKPDTLCPLISQNKANIRMLNIVYDSLFSVDENMNINPVLAQSFESSDNNQKYTVRLKKNVFFHDGTALTADDVVFSVDTIKAHSESAYSYNVSHIKSVNASDNYTLVFTLDKPLSRFAALLEFPIIKKQSEPIDPLSFEPVGTGGFIFENLNEGNLFHLVRNDNWWGGEVWLDSVRVKLLPDKDTAMYAFSLGDLSICPAENDDWGRFVNAQSSSYMKYSQGAYHFLAFNSSNKLLALPEVRQAVSDALNREEILKSGVMDFGTPADIPVKEKWGFTEKGFDNKSNPNHARQVLEENEWTLKNGIYQKSINRKQQALKFEILINEESYKKEQLANVIEEELKEVGISVKLKKVSYEKYTELINSKNYDMFIGSTELTQELDFTNIFDKGNMLAFDEEAINKANDTLQLASDAEEYKQAMNEMRSTVNEINPFYGIGFEDLILLYKNNVKGNLSPTRNDIYNGIESVYLESK